MDPPNTQPPLSEPSPTQPHAAGSARVEPPGAKPRQPGPLKPPPANRRSSADAPSTAAPLSAKTGPDPLGLLIDRARQRETGALEELLRLHAERLLESIRAELGDRLRQRLESQDVMQQVYMDALRSIGQFVDQGHDSFFRWLRRIAVHRICDVDRREFRAAKRRGELRATDLGSDESMGFLLERLSGPASSPSAVAVAGDRISLLRRALEELNEDQREAIRLRYLHQLNVAETAARMDRSERAVRSLCVRALIRLRELLGDAV